MANVQWYAIYEQTTGRLHTTASIDLDDEDTAIDPVTGQPYSLSGMRGISHPDVTAGTHEYIHRADGTVEIRPRRGGPIDRGFEVKALTLSPNAPPPLKADGRYEWDETTREFIERSGIELKEKRLAALEAEVIRLRAEIAAERARG